MNRNLSNRFSGESSDLFYTPTRKESFTILIENKDSISYDVAILTGSFGPTDFAKVFSLNTVSLLKHGDIEKDGETVKLTANCPAIEHLRNFLVRNPTAVESIQVSAKDEVQLQRAIYYKRVHPYRDFGIDKLIPRDHQLSSDSNTKLINLRVNDLVLGDQSALGVSVAPGNWISLTFYFGASRDDFEMMHNYEVERAEKLR